MRNPMNNEVKIPSLEIKSSQLRTVLLIAGILMLTALFLSSCSSSKKEEAAKASEKAKEEAAKAADQAKGAAKKALGGALDRLRQKK